MEPLDALQPIAKRLDRYVGNIRHIAHLLDSKSEGAQVKRVVRTYLNRLQEQAPRRGRGAVTGHFIDHLVKVSNSYWPGLFHTYDDPRLPRTSNTLEGFFGSSKQRVRRTTGRMSTAGGKIDSEGEAILRVQGLLASLGVSALRALVTGITDPKYQQAKRRLRQLQEPARQRRSIQRDPQTYLDRTVDRWLNSS